MHPSEAVYNQTRTAIDYCLEQAGIGREQLNLVSFSDEPSSKFERML